MSQIETPALTSLSNGSENGVAPLSDSIVDMQCMWVAQHATGWQEGEQGVIEAVISCLEPNIPPEQRWVVEFGAGDNHTLPLTCGTLLQYEGWKGLLIESNPVLAKRLRARTPKHTVIVERMVATDGDDSIDRILSEHNATPNPAAMVVDIDGLDYFIAQSMKSRPVVLCVEHLDMESPQHRQHEKEAYIPAKEIAGNVIDDEFGAHDSANTLAFDGLIGGWGYKLVFRTRYNSIYVRGDMVPKLRKKCLNLGAGEHNYPGYEPVDIRVNGKGIETLDVPDGSCDEIYCSHAFEHLDFASAQIAMFNWTRALKPGGSLKIAVPDMKKIAVELASGKTDIDEGRMMAMIYGSQNYEQNYHRWGYTESILTQIMHSAGIGSIRKFSPFVPKDCSNNPYSLNLEGVKRWWPKIEKPKIVLVLSQPRFTFTGHEKALLDLAKKMDMEVVPAAGSFWDRDMTIGTRYAIGKHDPDFLLYSDYDSVFEVDDVRKLLDTINSDPQMAAIGSVQMSRHDDKPLLSDANGSPEGETPRVRYLHFGLTLIRREVFDELPQPWFWSVPGRDEKGEFDWQAWGRSDADITFWRNLDLMGFRVHQHSGVCIGHIVQSVKYPRETGKGVQLIPIENYWRHGKPKDAIFNPAIYKPKEQPQGTTNGKQ